MYRNIGQSFCVLLEYVSCDIARVERVPKRTVGQRQSMANKERAQHERRVERFERRQPVGGVAFAAQFDGALETRINLQTAVAAPAAAAAPDNSQNAPPQCHHRNTNNTNDARTRMRTCVNMSAEPSYSLAAGLARAK